MSIRNKKRSEGSAQNVVDEPVDAESTLDTKQASANADQNLIPSLQTLLEQTQAEYGNEHPHVADVLSTMAMVLISEGNKAAASSALSRALEIRSRNFGKDNLALAPLAEEIGRMHEQQSNWASAERSYLAALEVLIKQLGLSDNETQRMLSRMRHAIHQQNRDEQEADRIAAGIANSAMNDALDAFPWEQYRDQGEAALQVRNYKEAERVFSYLRDVTIALSPNSARYAQTLEFLSEAYFGLGKNDEAFRSRDRALGRYESALGPQHPSIARFLLRTTQMRQSNGEYAEAQAASHRAVRILQEALGPDHAETKSAQKLLDDLTAKLTPAAARNTPEFARHRLERMNAKRPAVLNALQQAEAESRQSVHSAMTVTPDAVSDVEGDDPESLWNKYMQQGKAALEAQNNSEAERLFALAVEKAEQFAPQDRKLWDSMCQLAAAYDATGKLYKATSTYKDVLKRCQDTHGPNSPHLVSYLRLVAKNHSDQGDVVRAIECYERIVKIYIDASAPAQMIQPYQEMLDRLQQDLQGS